MTGDFEDQAWVKMGVAAALSQQYTQDQASFLQLLSEVLTKANPSAVKPITKGLFRKELVGIEANFGADRYLIQKANDGSLMAVRTKVVRGIALKSEEVDMATCLTSIATYIEEAAKRNQQSRDAMAKLLGLQ